MGEKLRAVGGYRWTICALLFAATTINYLDRQVLSLLAPELSKPVAEGGFGWSETDYANITAVFQFVYALSMLFVGRFIDRLGTKWGYAIAIVLWSLGAMLHAASVWVGDAAVGILGVFGIVAVPSIVGFMISRAVLAFGEAGNFPAAIKATAEYFPKKERALATGIFNSGANIGAILAPITVPVIALHWGWEMAFIIVGIAGFVWLAFWLLFYEKPQQQRRLSVAELEYINSDAEVSVTDLTVEAQPKVSWFRLLQFRQTWAFATGKFMTDGVWWFFLFWLPKYLSAQYDIESSEMQLPLAVLYTMTMFGSIAGGWFPMYFIKKGYEPYGGRIRAMFFIALIPLVVLAAQPLGAYGFWLPVVLIGIGASAHQAWSANIFSTVSDMFPKKAIGSVTGIGGMAGGIGGVIITKTGGALFDHYKALGHIEMGYTIMFAFCAFAYIIAWGIIKTLVPTYKPVDLD
nr:MFS transporter [uncultured Flavobacterium sp.]